MPVAIGVIALALGVLGVLAAHFAYPGRRAPVVAAIAIAAWLALLGLAGASGVLARFDLRPPPIVLWMAVTLFAGVGVGCSRFGGRLATAPLWILVGFQAFRLPLELVMHRLAGAGEMPSVMSFGGYNFDIVSGASALLLGLALYRGDVPRWIVIAWNVVGAALLLAIITIAVAATPLLRAFGDDQVNLWVTRFPYTWMSVMVAAGLAGHIVLTRRLLR